MPKRLCIIHEAIGEQSAIAKVARDGVEMALRAGWHVSVVAKHLDASLVNRVEWLKLYVPPRGFALKWLTAANFIRGAIGDRQFDVVHAHQPQAIAIADVFQCHFLTRASYVRGCLASGPGWKRKLARGQELLVMAAEDRCYRGRNPKCRLLFNSDMTRRDFQKLYGKSHHEEALVLPCQEPRVATESERTEAHIKLLGRVVSKTVVGFLGGTQTRKGFQRLIKGLLEEKNVFLLMGGSGTKDFAVPELGDRFCNVGYSNDTATFYAACDVFIVPSHYEPLGLVAFEAASRGVPVIATDEVGALPYLVRHNAGKRWDGREALGPHISDVMARRKEFVAGCVALARALNRSQYDQRLLAHYEAVVAERERLVATSHAETVEARSRLA